MARLMVSFQGAEFAFDLRGEGVRVGSGTSCGLVLKDPAVSREHFELRRAGPAWKLLDLESASGTRVNGLYVNKHDLKAGDVVAIGAARLTFQADEAQEPVPVPVPGAYPAASPGPAPIPQAAPIPVPMAAPAPIPGASPWGYAAAPPPPAYPAQAYAPPPARSGSRRAPSRDDYRDRDRDRDRDRPSRGQRRGGGGGGTGIILAFVLVATAVGLGFAFLGKEAKRVDTNLPLVQNAETLEKQGNYEALVAMEGQGDPSFPDSYRQIQNAVARGKKNYEIVKGDREKAESDDYFKVQIHDPHETGSMDSSAMVLRCDEFIRRWPNHERAEDANFIRMSLTGEPSPSWTAAKGTGPGKAFVSVTTLLDAAEMEAGRRLAAGRFVQSCGVYDMFLARAVATVAPERQAEFKAGMAKKKKFITDKAKDAFDKIEEKAMVLEDRKQYQAAEDLYREARENIAMGDNVKRCDEEISRLQQFHR